MKSVNIHEAKTHLSRLLDEVSRGEEITIAKAGKPIARLVPVTASRPTRTPGFLRGKIRISDDFDEPLPVDIQKSFEGSDD
ncbi:MAG: type II toxin-antitoxin system Phd/YefM family antitoxin [Sulfobacillus thermotolerans]|uniref:Antitoxin n=1 Tax=Sulfobacillus thermotolerans TaxID=338644 RepID=A0ABN5H2U5_9FIRM|nr:prevent-host-death protein [Sulfobacillus thermotolerans]MCY0908453.1 type II toxin-antitoxin system Phd/YefM family antitoxin [Sulfobacillus thermotolerans]